ncbi:hypothetical protein CDAR_449531 [Caerostris darwini]|uniref:Uncharacterized protein n=1 Tax=Caerostris darwini TaxID=1538125 RepID=A0AAV4QUR2_9ARAC|nr:hypothetical protein CDAR_449531 [Caerostris darwini]
MALTITRFDLGRFLVMGILDLCLVLGICVQRFPSHFGGTERSHLNVSGINVNMLPSAVIDIVARLACLIPCGGGHFEHLLFEINAISCYCHLFPCLIMLA